MRKKYTLKATAMILTVSMLITGIPFSTFETIAQETDPESEGKDIVCEVVEKRDRYSKTFLRADETYVAVTSAQALHYQDSDGNWQDIDNTLEPATDEKGEEVVTNKDNDFSVEFPKTLDDEKQVTIEKSKFSISFKLLDSVKKSKSKIRNNKKQKQNKKSIDTQIKAEEKVSAVSYSNVLQDTDIVYNIKPQEVKESIILSKKPKKNAAYTYQLTAVGLTAKLQKDNSIEFYEKGKDEPEFVMPAPYMFDSAEVYSQDISVTLKKEKDGLYTMTYTPSHKWLNDKDREYPVTIDPTVTTARVKGNIQDTRIKKNSPYDVLGSMNSIYATSAEDSAGESHALVKFNELTDGGVITKASLCLIGARNYSDPLSLRVYRMTGDWDESTANYHNTNSLIAEEADDYVDYETPPAYEGVYRFDITRMYHDWTVNGNNYGVAIKNSGEGNPTAEWFSSDRPETYRYPYIEVEYQSGAAMDSSFDSHQFDAGRAGTLYLNDFSGDMMLSRSDIGFDGNIMPVNISMLYDPLSYRWNAGNPYPWKTNYEWRLYYGTLQSRIVDENNVTVYLNKIDTESGKPSVYWETVSQGEEGEEYSGYKLEVDGNSRKLTAPDGRVLDFSVYNSPYYLPSSISKENKSIKLFWTSGKLIQILDGTNRKYALNYDTEGRLTSIQYYGAGTTVLKTIQYKYDTEGNLTSAVYPDGNSVKYTYEAGSGNTYRLTSVTDVDGYTLKLSYTAGTLSRVNKIEEFASDGTAGNKVNITYRVYSTTFTDSTGKEETKQFDKYGQTTCTRDENGYAVFTSYDNLSKGQFLGTSTIQIPGENNLVENWKFDSKNANWHFTPGVIAAGQITGPIEELDYGARIEADPRYYNCASQVIQIEGKAGDVFAYGGWIKTNNNLPFETTSGSKRPISIKISFELDDSVAEYTMPCINANTYCDGWQYLKDSFELPCDVDAITISIYADGQNGDIMATGIELQRQQPSFYYTTDSYGSIIKQEGEEPKEQENSLLSTDRSQSSEDDKGRLKESISAEGVGSTYAYDENGNITSEITTNGRVKMETKNTYTADGNYLASTADPLGNSVVYQYDASLGTLKNMTDANGSNTNYTYDNLQRLAGVSATASGAGTSTAMHNRYTYEYDRLKTITKNNGVAYSFDYDKWGSQSGVKVGSQSLLTNKYLNNITRLLDTVTYGNGQTLKYSYDSKNRLTGLRFNGDSADRFSYTYENGKLVEMRDTVNDTLTKYKDELIEEYTLDGSTLKHSYVTKDSEFIEKIQYTTVTTKFKKDKDDRPISTSYEYEVGKSASTEIRYDDLGRVINKGAYITQNGTDKPVYMSSYQYRELAGFKSSEQVASIGYSYGSGAQPNSTLSYTYDKAGNIISISKGGSPYKSYEYDTVGQLIRANEADTNTTTTYQYDAGGNITAKTEYDYTTGVLGTVKNTITYGYTDSNWKDKLTSYNGKAITYDEIGNPTSYDGWTYLWEGGRQLKRMTKNGSAIDYKYNASGMRTSKTVNGVTTNYTLVDDRITAQETDDEWTYFRYNEDGEIISLRYGGNEYFYVRNLQNDIIGLVDLSGSLVVEYAYDVWGRVISTTGSLASTLGASNPFRYRGYYFDTETGLYYLQSRYYDAQWGRFLNADEPNIMGVLLNNPLGTNLFAYCYNNPVMFSDTTGYFSIPRGIVSFAIDAIIWGIFSAGAATFAALTQPIKAVARSAGQAFIKAKMLGILRGFSNTLTKAFVAIAKVIVPVIKKAVGWIFRKWAAKQTVSLWAGKMAGGLASLTTNAFLNAIAKNITVFLSIGGLVGGLLDYFTDKKLNGWIKLW